MAYSPPLSPTPVVSVTIAWVPVKDPFSRKTIYMADTFMLAADWRLIQVLSARGLSLYLYSHLHRDPQASPRMMTGFQELQFQETEKWRLLVFYYLSSETRHHFSFILLMKQLQIHLDSRGGSIDSHHFQSTTIFKNRVSEVPLIVMRVVRQFACLLCSTDPWNPTPYSSITSSLWVTGSSEFWIYCGCWVVEVAIQEIEHFLGQAQDINEYQQVPVLLTVCEDHGVLMCLCCALLSMGYFSLTETFPGVLTNWKPFKFSWKLRSSTSCCTPVLVSLGWYNRVP